MERTDKVRVEEMGRGVNGRWRMRRILSLRQARPATSLVRGRGGLLRDDVVRTGPSGRQEIPRLWLGMTEEVKPVAGGDAGLEAKDGAVKGAKAREE